MGHNLASAGPTPGPQHHHRRNPSPPSTHTPPILPAKAAAHAAQCSFTIKAREGAARAGVLRLPSGSTVDTPLSLLYTRRGAPPSLTPDMIQRLTPTPTAYQIDILQFLAGPTPETLSLYGRGARGFLALEGASLVLASNRDPGQYEYGAKPSSDKALYCTIHVGGKTVTPENYMAVVLALQPDLYVTMCDELTADAKPKSVKTSVNRTSAWMDACLRLQQERGVTAVPLAAVAGGTIEAERARSAREAAARADGVAGFALCGFGTGEDPAPAPEPTLEGPATAVPKLISVLESAAAATERAADTGAPGADLRVGQKANTGLVAGGRVSLLRAAIEQLPAEKVRFISGISSPPEVLDAIAEGVDVFDNAYVAAVTAGGYALSFPLSPNHDHNAQQGSAASVSVAATSGKGEDKPSLHTSVTATQPSPTASTHQPNIPTSTNHQPTTTNRQPTKATAAGAAGAAAAVAAHVQGGGGDGADPCKLNLWSVSYRTDKRPVLPGCSCFTCTNHSRAYIHHLLQVHEMVAEVLLEMHNTHHYHAFMGEVRKALMDGTFTQYRRWFRSQIGPAGSWSQLNVAPPSAPAAAGSPDKGKRETEGGEEGPTAAGPKRDRKRSEPGAGEHEPSDGEGQAAKDKKPRWQNV